MKRPLTIFAMTEKGYAVVRALIEKHRQLVKDVVGSRDQAVKNDFYNEISGLCREHDVPFHDRATFGSARTEYSLAVSWRWLIDAGPSSVIVFHDSLLPRYRGFNPLVTALINRDDAIGVTALYAGAEYDTGDIISSASSAISYPITIEQAISVIVPHYVSLAVQIAEEIASGSLPVGTPQSEAEASYSLWRDEDDYFIDWAASASMIRRMVDALGYPYKGAASRIEGTVVRIRSAEALPDVNIANRSPGKVIFFTGDKPIVVCGEGLLRIHELVGDKTGASMLPLPRFRTRFRSGSQLRLRRRP